MIYIQNPLKKALFSMLGFQTSSIDAFRAYLKVCGGRNFGTPPVPKLGFFLPPCTKIVFFTPCTKIKIF